MSGTGSFTQSGGTNSVPYPNSLYVAQDGGSSGSYNLSGKGLLSPETEYIGQGGTGSFTQSGGTNAIYSSSAGLYRGYAQGSGSYNLGGTGLLSVAGYEYIGYPGTGSFTQCGGTNAVSNSIYIAGDAVYALRGGGVVALGESIGHAGGTGSFMQSGGTNLVSSLYLGDVSGSGTYSLSGSGLLSAPNEYIGYFATGTFTQSGGTNTVSNVLYVGYTTGTYSLSGSGLLSAPTEYIGYASGTGSFTQSGGTNSVSGNLALGDGPNSAGTYNLDGGLLSLSALTKGSGSSLFTQGPVSATFNFSGGTFQALLTFSTSVPIVLSTAGGNGVFDTNGNTLTLAGTLSGPGGLQKVGSGTLTLVAANTYTGGTTIAAGTLKLDFSQTARQRPTSSTTPPTLLLWSWTAAPWQSKAI